jgi:murein DD-endopeptidase MepM/ murein hydrolase activator NlpD
LIYLIKKILLTVGGLSIGAGLASGAFYVSSKTSTFKLIIPKFKDVSVATETTKFWGDMPIDQTMSSFSFVAPELKSKKDFYFELSKDNSNLKNGRGGGFYFGGNNDLGIRNLNSFNLPSLRSNIEGIINKRDYSDSVSNIKNRIEAIIDGIPVGAPVIGRLTSHYGRRLSPFGRNSDFHTGIDIATDFNSPVVASANGVILFAGYKGSYGRTVLIRHNNGIETLYAHLSRIEVKAGEKVIRGKRIGLLGSSGKSTGPHLHYEVRHNGQPINPKGYIELAKLIRSIN